MGKLPSPARILARGKRYFERTKQWYGTVTAFSATALVGTLYFTDWKLVLEYLPYYRGKFKVKQD